MTVKELIEQLSKMPEEEEVYIRVSYNDEDNYDDLFSIQRIVQLQNGSIELEYF